MRMPLWTVGVVGAVAGAAAAEPPTVVSRPTYIRGDVGIGAPTGLAGVTVGHALDPPWALELGLGLGLTGWQLAGMARYYAPAGDSARWSWSFAAGPSLSLLGRSLGLRVPHEPDVTVPDGAIYTILGANAEAGLELRVGWGGLVRIALGGFLALHEDMSPLCRERSETLDCAGLHFPSGPAVARLPMYPYLAFGYGWSF
jgi:hypothetical protein